MQLLLQLLLQNTALQLRCRMPLLLGAAQSCLSNASLHLALHNRLGLRLHFLHLALYDCQGLQLHFSNASLHLALHNCPGLHLHFCTLPSTIARDCSCTLCSCTLHLDTCDVPRRGREREMETLGRRREKKCRDALSFSLRKNNFYATNEKTRLLAQSVFARMDLSI